MAVLKTVYAIVSFSIALVCSTFYFVYFGVKKRLTTVGIKRVWLFAMALMSTNCFFRLPGIAPKFAAFFMFTSLGVLAGHLRKPVFIKDNSRPISSGNNIWDKILIFLWY